MNNQSGYFASTTVDSGAVLSAEDTKFYSSIRGLRSARVNFATADETGSTTIPFYITEELVITTTCHTTPIEATT